MIMEYNARMKMGQRHLHAMKNGEQYPSRSVNMRNERDERSNDRMKVHLMTGDVKKTTQKSRIEINSNKNMSILSLLEG